MTQILAHKITHDETFGDAVREFSHFTSKGDPQDSMGSRQSHPQSHEFAIQIRIKPGSAMSTSSKRKGGQSRRRNANDERPRTND